MKPSRKPVRKCYACPLNLGKSCWLYKYPRGQWQHNRKCTAIDNKKIHDEFCTWQKQPTVKTRKELRREFFRSRKRSQLHHDPIGHRR